MMRKIANLSRENVSWILIAMAYAIAFMQRMSPQAMTADLAHDFSTNLAGIGVIASAYFYGYMLIQIPAGVLVDIFGVRKVVLASLFTSTAGTLLFSCSGNLAMVFLARVVIACGDGLVFAALLKHVALQFSDRRFGLMSGVSQVSGYIGGVLATTPLTAAVSIYGWRTCFGLIALISFANLVFCYFILPGVAAVKKDDIGNRVKALLRSIADLLSYRAAWGCALTFTSHFVVVTTLAGVWGLPLVMYTFGIARNTASICILAFMVANAMGSIVGGYISDRVSQLIKSLLLNCVLRITLLLALMPLLARNFGLAYGVLCFSLLGLVAGGTIPLVLKSLKNIYSARFIGAGASINTTLAGIVGAVIQPLLGMVLAGISENKSTITDPILGSYDMFVLILVLISLGGVVGPFMMRGKSGLEMKGRSLA
jgi:MFS family permease